jgi:hypothetical protein
MFEGEEGDADGLLVASRCSSSSTLRAADKGKRGDGDNIDGNVEGGMEGEVEGEMEGRDDGREETGGEREGAESRSSGESDGRGGMSLSAADMSAMVCCTPRMKAALLT